MLKVAGATALGAAGAAVARAAPAAANDGDAITVGNQVDLSSGSTARTVLYAGTGGAFGRTSVFNVVDQAFTAFPDNGDAVIYGGGGSKVLNGVAGTSTDPDGFGVRGQATGEFSVGVVGTSTGSQGDGGLFTGITGVAASGSRYDLRLHQGRLGVVSGYAALPSDASRGDQVTMNDGTLWYCVTGVPGTTPGIWRRMAAPGTAGALTVLPSPVRVYDSRKTGGPLRNGQERTVSLDNGLVGNTPTPAVPAGAIASLFTLTIVNTGSSGFLAAFSNDVSYPGTSNIDWFLTNSILATSVTSAVDPAAKIKLHCGGTQTNFVIDVTGYYQ